MRKRNITRPLRRSAQSRMPTLTHAKNLIREFCQEEYDSEPDFSNLSKIGIAYTHATDEEIPIQVNVDLVGYRVERYLGEVLIDERQYESLEELTETELEALDFSELVSVTDEELEHYHSKAEERPALLPLDAATEYNALKEQHPDALVGFEQGGQFEFYGRGCPEGLRTSGRQSCWKRKRHWAPSRSPAFPATSGHTVPSNCGSAARTSTLPG